MSQKSMKFQRYFDSSDESSSDSDNNTKRMKKKTSTSHPTSFKSYLQSTETTKTRSLQLKSPSKNLKPTEAATKYKITQKVQDPSAQKSGPRIIKRNIDDAKHIQIGRRFGEGSKPLFDAIAKAQASVTKSRESVGTLSVPRSPPRAYRRGNHNPRSSSSSSSSRSSSHSRRRRSKSSTHSRHESRRKSRDKSPEYKPYFRDPKREMERLATKYRPPSPNPRYRNRSRSPRGRDRDQTPVQPIIIQMPMPPPPFGYGPPHQYPPWMPPGIPHQFQHRGQIPPHFMNQQPHPLMPYPYQYNYNTLMTQRFQGSRPYFNGPPRPLMNARNQFNPNRN